MKQTTFSQTFFLMCITSKVCQIYKFYNVHHKPFHINPTLINKLSAFKNQPREVTTPPEHIFVYVYNGWKNLPLICMAIKIKKEVQKLQTKSHKLKSQCYIQFLLTKLKCRYQKTITQNIY